MLLALSSAGDSCVFVGRDLLKDIPAELTPENGIKASKFIIVGDSNVRPPRLHREGHRALRASLTL